MRNTKKGANITMVIVIVAILSIIVIGFMNTSSAQVGNVASRRANLQAYYDAKATNEAVVTMLMSNSHGEDLYTIMDTDYATHQAEPQKDLRYDLGDSIELPSANSATVRLNYQERKMNPSDDHFAVLMNIETTVNGFRYCSQITSTRKTPPPDEANFATVRNTGAYVYTALGNNSSNLSLGDVTFFGCVYGHGTINIHGRVNVREIDKYKDVGYDPSRANSIKRGDIICFPSNNPINIRPGSASVINANILDTNGRDIQIYDDAEITGNITTKHGFAYYGGTINANSHIYTMGDNGWGGGDTVGKVVFDGIWKCAGKIQEDNNPVVFGPHAQVYAREYNFGPTNGSATTNGSKVTTGWDSTTEPALGKSSWITAMNESTKMQTMIEYNYTRLHLPWERGMDKYDWSTGTNYGSWYNSTYWWSTRPSLYDKVVSYQYSWGMSPNDFSSNPAYFLFQDNGGGRVNGQGTVAVSDNTCGGKRIVNSIDTVKRVGTQYTIDDAFTGGLDVPNMDLFIGIPYGHAPVEMSQISIDTTKIHNAATARVFIYLGAQTTINIKSTGNPDDLFTIEDDKSLAMLHYTLADPALQDTVSTRLCIINEQNALIKVDPNVNALCRFYNMTGNENSGKGLIFGENDNIFGRVTTFNAPEGSGSNPAAIGDGCTFTLIAEESRPGDDFPAYPVKPDTVDILNVDSLSSDTTWDHMFRFYNSYSEKYDSDEIKVVNYKAKAGEEL